MSLLFFFFLLYSRHKQGSTYEEGSRKVNNTKRASRQTNKTARDPRFTPVISGAPRRQLWSEYLRNIYSRRPEKVGSQASNNRMCVASLRKRTHHIIEFGPLLEDAQKKPFNTETNDTTQVESKRRPQLPVHVENVGRDRTLITCCNPFSSFMRKSWAAGSPAALARDTLEGNKRAELNPVVCALVSPSRRDLAP